MTAGILILAIFGCVAIFAEAWMPYPREELFTPYSAALPGTSAGDE